MDKQRYEYYNGSTTIIDNELDTYVEDVVDRLNTQDFNKNELLKVKQRLESKVADLEAKLAESEKKSKTYAKEIVFLDKKLENLNKEFELAQEHNEKTVEYWQNECSQLKKQLAEKDQAIEGLQEINQSLGQTCNNDAKEIERLREKENLLNLIVDGYYTPTNIVKRQIREQNQTAIAELEKVKAKVRDVSGALALCEVEVQIDKQIKSLKGDSQ